MDAQRPTDAAAASGESPATLTQQLVQLNQIARERVGPDAAPATHGPAQPHQERLQETLKRLENAGKRRAERTRNEGVACETADSAISASDTPAKRHRNGHSNQTLVSTASDALETIARQRGLEQTAMCATSEYPTTLTRLPLFPPVTRETAIEMFKRGWVKLQSSWDGGGVYRSGPALNIYDEDTLLGLMVLRSRRLMGPADHMPTAVRRLDTEDTTPTDERVQVDIVVFTISQLETAIHGYTPRKGWGGRELARRRESIEDLYGLQLRFDKVRDGSRYQRVKISLFDIPEFSKERDACYYVQFDPLVSRWLENYHTFISLSLRRKLSDLGKALHRFLASQRSNSVYRIDAITLYEAIGAQDRVWKLNQNARKQLTIMQQERFITSFRIDGTGRSTPFVLHIVFPRKS
ncbi:hypothetical protein [Lamprocystis purpurea]|jgi:hypothetical protein|uniref:hypothetical protein n=1 Tax=Lamprocystis purpurea TaxID=61598 RepID=UPI0012F90587|nr:hypothetical protein [Lamprocystis purpurea]